MENSSEIFARLERDPEVEAIETTDALDQEISEWCVTGVRRQHVQIIDTLRLASWGDAQRLAEKIAATCNGALLENSEFGYLLFEVSSIQIRTELDNHSSAWLPKDNLAAIEQAVQESVEAFIKPTSTIRISHQPVIAANGRTYVYFRLTPVNGLVTFNRQTRTDLNSPWRILVWQHNNQVSWQISPASKDVCSKLYLANLKSLNSRVEVQELRTVNPDDPDSPVIFEERLNHQAPGSLKEFIEFLTIALLSDDSAERATAILLYKTIADVCGDYRVQISKLLLGLLSDESHIATCCLETLEQLKEQSCFYVLKYLWEYLNDPVVRLKIVPCLAELAPGEQVLEDIKKLWTVDNNDYQIKEAFDDATERIYKRFQIRRFDQSARDELMALLHTFSYERALEFLAQRDRQICSKMECRILLQTLVRYGSLRSGEDDLINAKNELERCKAQYESLLSRDTIAHPWFQTRIDELHLLIGHCEEDAIKLVNTLAQIEDAARADELSGFLNKIYNFVEQVLEYWASKLGIPFTKPKNSVRFDPNWSVEAKKHLPELRKGSVNRHTWKEVIPYWIKQTSNASTTVDDLEQTIDFLEPFIQQRNLSKGGHGPNAVTRQSLNASIGKSPEDALEGLGILLDMALGQSIRLSSLHSLNLDIQRFLRWSDNLPMTIDDIVE